jgi:hypothetical protein
MTEANERLGVSEEGAEILVDWAGSDATLSFVHEVKKNWVCSETENRALAFEALSQISWVIRAIQPILARHSEAKIFDSWNRCLTPGHCWIRHFHVS